MHTRITLFFISILFVITNTRGQNKINAIAKVNQEQGNYAVSLRRLLEIFKLTDEQLKKDKISIMDSVRNYLNGIPDIKNGKNPKYDKLISDYAFRKLIKKNFHSLILGNDEVSKIGRYATLDIADKTNFSFSPLVFESNTFTRRFQHIFSLTVSGKTDGAGVFKLKEFRDLKAAFSWKFILPLTNYKPVGRAESLSKFKHILNEGINDLSDSYEEKFKKIDSSKFLGEAQKKEHKIKLS